MVSLSGGKRRRSKSVKQSYRTRKRLRKRNIFTRKCRMRSRKNVKRLRGGQQPLKVAILLSGRIKGYENVKKNLTNIVNRYHPIFFVSLNKKNKSSYIETFCKEYNISDDRLHLELAKTPDYIKTLNKAPEISVDGTYSMFYNTHVAFKMLEIYQEANSMQFDCILFYRADLDSLETIHLVKPAKRTIYVPIGDDHGGLNGLIGYGDFYTMKIYCNLVNSIHKICVEQGVVFHPETLIKKNIDNNNIIVERFQYRYSLHESRKQPNHIYNTIE